MLRLQGLGAMLLVAVTLSTAQAQEMLSNLHIVGTIERTGGAPAFKVGDTVKAIEDKGGAVAGTGSIVDGRGTYFIEMSKAAHYNGTPLHFDIVVAGEQLPLREGKSEARLIYKGGFPFPKRETKDLYYGNGNPAAKSTASTVASTTPSAKSVGPCPATLPKCDANGDGFFDQKDIDVVKAQLTAKSADPRADLNGDGVVNSADIVVGVRELNSKR